nr:MAG TPA: hypothetical protein [Bacteriophage sp.]
MIKFSVIMTPPPCHMYNWYYGKEATFSHKLQQIK